MSEPTFTDPSAPLDARVDDLKTRLTLPEKLALLHQRQAAVPRLGLQEFRTGTEALHGVAWLGPATVFPQAIGLAASWDLDLVRRVGRAVGDEVRGLHRKDPSRCGLNVWAPVVNPLRDPRWGRNEEGFAEDPWLTAEIATAYASGLRGDHPCFLATAPTLKHFLGYNHETDRDRSSSNLAPRVLYEYELPAYRRPLETGAAVAVMGSYNLVNDRPAQLSPLIERVLRKWAGNDLVVVSDAHAPSNLVRTQRYFDDHVDSHAAALRAGLDSFTDHDGESAPTVERLTVALERGLITEADVDRAVRRLLTLRFRLGEFDPDGSNPFSEIDQTVVNCQAHQNLARHAAQRGIVLLTHRGLLPLDPARHRRVAVIGPLSGALHTDWYSGTLPYAVTPLAGLTERFGGAAITWCEGVDRIRLHAIPAHSAYSAHSAHRPTTPAAEDGALEVDVFDWGDGRHALRSVTTGQYLRVDENAVLTADSAGPDGWVVRETFRFVEQAPDDASTAAVALRHLATGSYVRLDPTGGATISARIEDATWFRVEPIDDGVATAAADAAAADVAVVVLGNHPMVGGRETEDRTDLALPAAQAALLDAVVAANPDTVLVLTSSYPYALGRAAEHARAVLWSAHGGQEYGNALADVLTGAVDPVGRLTQTWYRSAADLPDLTDYDIIANDATYLYFRGEPLFPFGHGHSYTTFAYHDLRLSADRIAPGEDVEISVDVVNTGDRPGEEVVQLYTRQLRSRAKQPLRALRGFDRITLDPGERGTARFRLCADDLAFFDVTRGVMVVEAARHRVLIGRSATDIVCTGTLAVDGMQIGLRNPERLRAVDYDDCDGVRVCDFSPTDGDAVRATEPGGWLAFDTVAWSVPPARARLLVSRPVDTCGAVTLWSDDPLTGRRLGVATVPPTGDRYTFVEIGIDLASSIAATATAIDLYLVFDAPDTILAECRLEPA